MDKLHSMLNILDIFLNVGFVMVAITKLKDAINVLFVNKNYKSKFIAWDLFVLAIICICMYVMMIITRESQSWIAILAAIVVLYAISDGKNTKQLN